MDRILICIDTQHAYRSTTTSEHDDGNKMQTDANHAGKLYSVWTRGRKWKRRAYVGERADANKSSRVQRRDDGGREETTKTRKRRSE